MKVEAVQGKQVSLEWSEPLRDSGNGGTTLEFLSPFLWRAMDLTEAEDIKKRWQEYTGELYKKDLHDPDDHDGVITHLEPDILDCEVKGLRKHHYEQS